MNKEEAIKLLQMYEIDEHGEAELHTWYKGIDNDTREAIDMAISALSADDIFGKMREATKEESESVSNYIESISHTTEPKDRLIKFFADNLTDEDIAKGEEYAKGYADGLKDGIDIVDLTNGNTITKAEYDGEPSDLISEIIDECDEVCEHRHELIQRIKALPSVSAEPSRLTISKEEAEKLMIRPQKSNFIAPIIELNGDLISRTDAIEAIMGEPTDAHYPSWYADKIKVLPSAESKRWKWSSQFISEIQDTAIELLQKTGWMQEHDKQISEPKRGKWVDRTSCQVDEDAYEVAICSNCGAEITIEYPNDSYCPNCGTRMENNK